MSHRTLSYRTFASRLRAGLAALFAVTVLALPAQAADPVYPLGSRIGLVPPDGMVASTEFSGFADQGKDAVILLAVLPAEAFSQVEKTMDADALKKEGITLDKREPIQLGVGKAFLFTGREVAEKTHYRKWLLVAAMNDLTALVNVQAPESSVYSEQVVRAALMTLALRATIPDAEQLSLLPFTVGELAGFHVNRVLRGRALMLSDAPSDDAKDSAKDFGEGCGEGFRPSRHPGAFADRRSARRSDRGGRSREIRALGFWRNRRAARRPPHDVRTAAHRPAIGISDHGRGEGRRHGRRRAGGAMAALRQRRIPANGRRRAHRQMDERARQAAHGPRQHRPKINRALGPSGLSRAATWGRSAWSCANTAKTRPTS